MKPETILQALSETRPALLDEARETVSARSRNLRPLRRIALVAAAVALLAGTVFAAVTVLTPKISIDDRQPDNLDDSYFSLTLEENPAAEDAPGRLEVLYLPRALPEGAALTAASVEWSDRLTWAWTAPDGSQGAISFGQIPLQPDGREHPLTAFEGIDPKELEQGTLELNGMGCWTMTRRSAAGDTAWYYWLDEARHYLFHASFNEAVPQTEREAFLASVAPVTEEAFYDAIGLRGRTLWALSWTPEGYTETWKGLLTTADACDQSWNGVLTAAKAGLSGGQRFSNGESEIALEQNPGYELHDPGQQTSPEETEDPADVGPTVRLDRYETAERTVDGTKITVLTAAGEFDGKPVWEEVWSFAAPDGTPLRLSFCTGDGTEVDEAARLAVFRGLTPHTVGE